MSNEIKITVSGDNRSGPMFASAKSDVDKFFREILARAARSQVEMKVAGDRVGKAFGEGIKDGIKSKGDLLAASADTLLMRAAPKATASGQKIGENIGDGIRRGAKGGLDKIRREIVEWVLELRTQLALQGALIGQAFGGAMAREFKQALHQLERNALETYLRMAAEAKIAGHEIGNNLGDGMRGGVGSIGVNLGTQMGKGISVGLTNPYVIAGILTAVASLLPAVGALITGSVLAAVGGGVLAAGVAAVWKDPAVSGDKKPRQEEYTKGLDKATAKYEAAHARWIKLMALQGTDKAKKSALYDERMAQMDIKHFKKALADLDKEAIKGWAKVKSRASAMWDNFGDTFKPAAVRMMDNLAKTVDEISPGFEKMGATMAPVLDTLIPALGDFIENMMPGLQNSLEASIPFFSMMADRLPELGTSMSRFFDSIAEGGPGATTFFDHLFRVLGWLIESFGSLLAALSNTYEYMNGFARATLMLFAAMAKGINNIFGTIVETILETLSYLPNGMGQAAKAALAKFRAFRKGVDAIAEDIQNSIQFHISVDTAGALRKIGAVRSALNDVQLAGAGAYIGRGGYGGGGIVGAATGGIHGGMRLVGERGPELVNLAPGSSVTPAGATRNLLNGAGGSSPVEVLLRIGWDNNVPQAVKDWLKKTVSIDGGGDVQIAFGS